MKILPRPNFRKFIAKDRPEKYLQSDSPLIDNVVSTLFGGINELLPGSKINDNELTFSRNGFSKNGVFSKCPGLSTYGSGLPLNGKIWALVDFKLINDTSQKVAVTSDNVYYYNTSNSTWTKVGGSAIFTGTATDRISCQVVYSETVGDYILIMTNYVDTIQYYDGTDTHNLHTAWKARFTKNYENCQFFGDIYEGTSRYGQRIYWSDIGKPETTSGGISGGASLVKSQKFIQGFALLGGALLAFKDNSISLITYTGSYNYPFSIQENLIDVGTRSIETAVPIGDELLFLGSDRNVYVTDGAMRKCVSDRVRKALCNRIDPTNMMKNFATLMNDNKWYVLSVVTEPGEPSECWVLDLEDWTWQPFQSWNKMLSACTFSKPGITIGEMTGKIYTYNMPIYDFQQMSYITLLGDSDGYIYQQGGEILNDNGTAIEQVCETKDFVWDERLEKRIAELIAELRGRGSVELWYSTDKGATWDYVSSHSITDSWNEHIYRPNKTCQMIRFRFRQNAVDEYYSIQEFNPRRIEKGMVADAS